MKKLFIIFLFLNLGFNLNAQKVENSKFRLLDTYVSNTLQLETNPVVTSNIKVIIFTAGNKDINTDRTNIDLTIHRGRMIHDLDISGLAKGVYFVEIIQKGKRTFRQKFNKE